MRRASVRLIVDLNLLTDSPAASAAWARAVVRALPRRSLVGFEIGDEPDIYSRAYWLAIVLRTGFGARVLPPGMTASRYVRDFLTDAHAIARVAPGVPLLGPALAHPQRNADWLARLLPVARGKLGVVTVHRYPYSGCAKPRSRAYPTIARVLSEQASVGLARSVGPDIRAAHAAGLPLRLTEMNSVTCGGRRGVSNTFATALWAPDALFELLRARADGVNVHVRGQRINAAFTLGAGGLSARPLLYGLILFAWTLGPDARLLPLVVRAPRGSRLKVWAVQTRDSLHVLLIDKGRPRPPSPSGLRAMARQPCSD